MIILETLSIRDFKTLRLVDLIFPRQASVLIEGWNESGKSTLFEAIIVALYGNLLVFEETQGSGVARAASAVNYASDQASIHLAIDIDGTKLEIERVLLRQGTTRAKLTVRGRDGKIEKVTGPKAVNDRIFQELGNLSADALLNSCFVEQKKLGKLEEMDTKQRRESLEALLNLSRLQTLQRRYKPTNEERDALQHAEERYEIARIDAEELPRLAAALAAALQRRQESQHVATGRMIAALHAQATTLSGEARALDQKQHLIEQQIQELKSLHALQQSLAKILTRLETRQHFMQQARAIGVEIAHCDQVAQSTLPDLTQRQERLQRLAQLHHIVDVNERAAHEAAAIQHQRTAIAESEQQITAITVAMSTIPEDAQLAEVHAQAIAKYRTAAERAALVDWEASADDQEQLESLRVKAEQESRMVATYAALAENSASTAEMARRAALRSGAVAGILTLFLFGLLLARAYWGIVIILPVALLAWTTARSLRKAESASKSEAIAHETQHAAERRAAEVAGEARTRRDVGGARQRAEAEARMRELGSAPPANRADARARIAALSGVNGDLAALRQAIDQAVLARQMAAATRKQRAEEKLRLQTLRDGLREQIAHAANQHEEVAEEVDHHATIREARAAITTMSAALGIPPEVIATQQAIGAALQEEARLKSIIDNRPHLLAAQARSAMDIHECDATISAEWAMITHQHAIVFQHNDTPLAQITTATPIPERATIDALMTAVTARIDADEVAMPELRRSELQRRQGEIAAQRAAIEEEIARLVAVDPSLATASHSVLRASGEVSNSGAFTAIPADPAEILPIQLAEPEGRDTMEALDTLVETGKIDLQAARQRRAERAAELGIRPEEKVDLNVCASEVERLRRSIQIRQRAFDMIETARSRMITKVLPQTARNMSSLLPILTLDRYHECEITPEYKLRVWDSEARRFVAKNIYSGGTRDQISLALRLAFALATLPEALGTTPGFIFLDEPLSSFDGPRSAALVNLVTHGQIHAEFAQIFVISHNLAFDRHAFTHHLRLENGLVVESTLPQ